ncbi:ATP-grasp domain-containing protein [Pararhodonellum marinum]|uniref:hypothetical protein n=1 Tax=Pararhodonellum marinum TaxID=2755358 RepID=UPI001E485040|nr:hypothetical protein [Pararhodonellum marinum]
MKILITGVGGPTPRSFALSLQRYSQYADWEFFGTDINPHAVGLYRKDLFKESFLIAPASDPEAYWKDIEAIITAKNIDYAIILPELEVMEWSKRKMQGGKLPCPSLIPDPKVTELLVSKSRMTDLLEDMDLVPASVSFHRGQRDFKGLFDKLGFPFWVRSSSGTSGLGSLKVENEAALKNWIQINPEVEQFLASTFLPGRNLACKLLYWKGKLLRAASGERVNYIMAKVAPSGITGNTSFGRLLNEPHLVELSKKAMDKVFDETGTEPHGFFTADFKEDEKGKPYITEINVRHVAFTQCFAAGGANFPEDTIRLLDADPDFDFTYRMYEFEKDLIFLRDVDVEPILMKEGELLKVYHSPVGQNI